MTSLYSAFLVINVLGFFGDLAFGVGPDPREMSIDEYIKYVNPPAVHKYQDKSGQTIRCVKFADQISIKYGNFPQRTDEEWARLNDEKAEENLRRMMQLSDDGRIKSEELNTSKTVSDIRRVQFEPSHCPEGTVPVMEIKREVVERFGSVRNYLRKYPHPFPDPDPRLQEQRATPPDFGGEAGCSSYALN